MYMYRMAGLLLLLITGGCTTIRSTVVNRTANDCYHENFEHPVAGIPITLKVPTHVDIRIIETSYHENISVTDDVIDLRPVKTRRNLAVDATPVETEKVFTVDFKRPFSGSLAYGAEIGDDQFFDKISGEIVDSTITDVANAISIIPSLGALPTSADSTKNVMTTKRVVAWKRFDINSCTYENDVLGFVSSHLNNCSPRCHGQFAE